MQYFAISILVIISIFAGWAFTEWWAARKVLRQVEKLRNATVEEVRRLAQENARSHVKGSVEDLNWIRQRRVEQEKK